MKKRIVWLVVLTLALTLLCATAMAAKNGWQIDGTYISYFKNGKAVTGSQTIRENKVTRRYLFDENGHLTSTGSVVTVGGETYYVGPGNMLQEGFVNANGGKYYFDGTKKAVKGLQEISGYYYYFDPETCAAVTNDGRLLNNQLFNFNADGILISNNKTITIDGEIYHLTSAAEAGGGQIENQKWDGWWTDPASPNARYYFGDYTSDDGTRHVGKGAARGGCYLLNSKEHYLFGTDGKQLFGFQTLNGKIYYYDFNSTAWAVNPAPQPGCRCYQGFETIDGNSYYFLEDGSAAVGITAVQAGPGSYNYYYFNEKGQQEIGRVIADGKIYFFNDASGLGVGGTMITDGWYNPFGTDWYYLTVNGALIGLQSIEDAPLGSGTFSKYYFNDEGCLQYRWVNLNNRLYYADPTNNGRLLTGWQSIDGHMYYFDKDNNYAVVGMQTLEAPPAPLSSLPAGAVYEFYFAGDGKRQGGLQTVGGKKYYFDPAQDFIRVDGWWQVGPDWYYFAPAALTSQTKFLLDPVTGADQKYYNFDAEGKATLANQGVYNFVTRLYSTLLGRTPEAGAVDYWSHRLLIGELDAATLVERIMASDEYIAFNLTGEQKVDRLYLTMMDRPSDADGQAYWAEFLNNGMSNVFVINGFSTSEEFGQLCYDYGISSGKIPDNQNRDVAMNVTGFVNRCYQNALGRDGDESGLNYWTGLLLTDSASPLQIARSFLNAPEFTALGLTDAQYVNVLYQLYMGRTGEADGIAYWTGRMAAGMTRDQVCEEFAKSAEFKAIVKSFGLK